MILVLLIVAAIALLVIAGVVWELGHAPLDGDPRCPKCGAAALQLDPPGHRRCLQCGTET